MKRKTEKYNVSHGSRWKSAWVVLVLVFSIISVPVAGEEDNTGNGTSIGLSPEQVTEESNDAGSSGNTGLSPEEETEETSDTDSQETAVQDQESTLEANDGSEGEETEIKAPEPETEANDDIENNDTIISPESRKIESEPQEEASDSVDEPESSEKGQEPETGLNNETPDEGNGATDPELKAGTDNGTQDEQSKEDGQEPEIVEYNSTEDQKAGIEDSNPETGQNESAETQDTVEETPGKETGQNNSLETHGAGIEDSDPQTGQNDSTENQENTGDNPAPGAGVEKGIESPVKEEVAPEQKTGEENTSESSGERTEYETGINNDIDEQESTEENQEAGTSGETDLKEDTVEKPEQNHEAGGKIASPESGGANPRFKEKAEDRTDIKKSNGDKTEPDARVCSITESPKAAEVEKEQGTQVCNGTKVLESRKVMPEVKIIECNLTGNLESKGVKPEIKICYWTNGTEKGTENGTENETLIPEIKQEESNWDNLKFILSYRYSLGSFYTVNESVKISYQGSETLGHNNVDIYLVKAYDPGFPEEIISNGTNGSKVSLGDILNNNTEFYVQIPAALNGDGDLAPLTLGPLPAGSYRVIITLAGNETEKPEPEKEVLSANYFEVLEYEMEAQAPYTLKEGESFEINLNLRNAPAQTGYTYWAVLVRADACETNENIPGRSAVWARPLVNGVDVIRNLEASLTENESGAGKDRLSSEIQTLIGEGNGTVSISEENQSTLSLTDLDLPPGDYILFTGAHEKDKGLTGLTRKELRISSESSQSAGFSSLSGTHPGSVFSMKGQYPSFMGISSIFENSESFVFEDIEPYIRTKAIAEVIKNPPKIPSFLLGFTGTLLIGLAVLRIKK